MPAGEPDTAHLRKARGAFFTPPLIAEFLTKWAIGKNPSARVLDPTCGDGVFLIAAGQRLRSLGTGAREVNEQLVGVDVHKSSLAQAREALAAHKLGAELIHSDFFDLSTPAQLEPRVGWCDSVVGNPPFIRYQDYGVEPRRQATRAALAQGVALNKLASSWAPLLVHASGFLRPEGRLAMVLPSEVLTVAYAEPIRRWLRSRFESVNLVFFSELQFEAEEQVVLLVAEGTGSCDAFAIYEVADASDLDDLHPLDAASAALRDDAKWSDLILPAGARRLFREHATERYVPLRSYGTLALGTVTGANQFFVMNECVRRERSLDEGLFKRVAPGVKHVKGLTFTQAHWEESKLAGHRVWLLCPNAGESKSRALNRYIAYGKEQAFDATYKCSIRDPWWRPPVVPTPDLFFTYMSHMHPRLIANTSGATILNSMHGMRLHDDNSSVARDALPLLTLNSITMLGAEILGRSHGGGILKMEPREASGLPLPRPEDLQSAWDVMAPRRAALDMALRRGDWEAVLADVDRVLLGGVLDLSQDAIEKIRNAATFLRVRRTRQTAGSDGR